MRPEGAEIWYLETGAVPDGAWPRLLAVLDETEQSRAATFKHENGRNAYVAAHALGRGLLSHALGGDPRQWRFTIDQRGKPEVAWQGGPRPRLNLSHTDGMVAAAFTLDDDIGIDVEHLGRRMNAMALAQRFFSAREVRALSASRQLERDFLSIWTLKEAYVKAIGKGLAEQLSAFTIGLDPPSITFHGAQGGGDWLLRRYVTDSGHVVALALGRPDTGAEMAFRRVGAADLLRVPSSIQS